MNLDNRVCRFTNADVNQTCLKVAFSSSIYRLRTFVHSRQPRLLRVIYFQIVMMVALPSVLSMGDMRRFL